MKFSPPAFRSVSFGILLLVGLATFSTTPVSLDATPTDFTVESPKHLPTWGGGCTTAMAKGMGRLMDAKLPEHFGVAPSTVTHNARQTVR